MLTGPVGQELGQGIVGMACLCPQCLGPQLKDSEAGGWLPEGALVWWLMLAVDKHFG